MGRHIHFAKNKDDYEPINIQEVIDKHDKKNRTEYKSTKTTARPRVFSELEKNNGAIIYKMGGKPVYLHSDAEYFRKGIAISINSMSHIVEKMVAERKKWMQRMSSLVKTLWNEKLKRLFPSGEISTFEQFKKLWNLSVMQHGKGTDAIGLLWYLSHAKIALTKSSAISFKISEARSSVRAQAKKEGRVSTDESGKDEVFNPTELDAYRMNKKLKPYFIEVGIARNKSGSHYSFKGTSIEDRKQLDSMYNEYMDIVYNSIINNVSGEFTEDAIQKTKELMASGLAPSVKIGRLAEIIEGSLNYETAAEIGAQEVTMRIIGTHISAEDSGGDKTTIADKADTLFTIEVSCGETSQMENFAFSDKTGKYLERDVLRLSRNRTVDVFTDTLQSTTYNFNNYGIPSNVNRQYNDKIVSLVRYVFYNDGALRGETKTGIVDFKRLVLLYAAWLKMGVEIVGLNKDPNSIPLAIKTLRTIYNTADLLDFFIDMPTETILEYVRKASKSNSTVFDIMEPVLTAPQRGQLFAAKKAIIENELNLNERKISYDIFMSNSTLMKFLESVQAGKKMPSLGYEIYIKLNNIANSL